MFGVYENFPKSIHAIALFNHQGSEKNLQQAILRSLHHLNNEVYDLGVVTPYLKQKCKVSFEFGVAEDNVFNFLDEKELEQCLKQITEKKFQTLDFFSVVRYHIFREGDKRIPLKFDYHVFRHTFSEGCLEMRIRHEKGTQRILLDDLTNFISKRVNAELFSKKLSPLVLRHFEKIRLQ